MNQPNEKALYVLEKWPHGRGGMQLCLHVIIRKSPSSGEPQLCFYDTDRGHMINGELKEQFTDGFTFLDTYKREWTLREVTLEDFRQRIFQYVGNGQAIADLAQSTEDLWEYFRKIFPIY